MLQRLRYCMPRGTVVCALVALGLGALSACGGGTSGTDGGHEYRISGTVEGSSGEPLAQALVSLLETGDSTSSGVDGSFVLQAATNAETLTLLVESQGRSAQVALSSLPAEDSAIEISLTFNPVGGSLSLLSIEVSPLGPSAAPTTPELNPSPTATAFSPQDQPQIPSDNVGTEKSILRGKVVDKDGAPLPDVVLKVPGLSAVRSDRNGRFQLKYPAGKTSLTLQIRYQGFSSSLELKKLPKEQSQVSVSLRLVLKRDGDTPSTQALERPTGISVSVQSISQQTLN